MNIVAEGVREDDGLRLRRWSSEEYLRMTEAGFFVDQRVELVRGYVVEMPPMLHAHAASLSLTYEALRAAFGPGYWIRTQMPLILTKDSVPEPDIAVVVGSPRDYQDHPATALLVVEVSDASIQYDRNVKGPLYALAGISEYWIVNLQQRQLEVHRDPQPDVTGLERSRYGHVQTFGPGERVTPLVAPSATLVAVDELLP